MGSLFRGALHFRLLVLAIAAGVLSIGMLQLRSAPVDVLPEFTPPYAEIQTEALGLSAEEVEQLITVPLEADLLNGVEGVDTIRSNSVPGLSSIVLVFTPGTDVYRARQLVEERLTQAHALPNVSKPPMLLQPLSSASRVLMIGLRSDKVSAIEQSVIARWTVRPRLMGVPGVANVAVWGMRDQQLQVLVDPAKLRAQGVTLNQVVSSAGNAQVVSPLTFLEASTPGTGGFIETPQQRLQVRHLLEKIADPRELGKVPVDGTGGRLRLSDVATIKVDHQPLIGDAVVAGGPGLMLVVEKFPGTSAREVTEGVERALEGLRPGLADITTDTSLFRPASYLEDATDNLGLALGAGFLLMLIVLVALRFHWRGVLIAALTVPLSLVVALLMLRVLGQGFNALVLAGLAAAVAVMVDEAVVTTDRTMHGLRRQGGVPRQPDERRDPVPLLSVVSKAAYDVRSPLTYATVILLLAVLPVAVLGGRPGDFFAPMVLAYAVAVLAALVVALTVTPVLALLLFPRWKPFRRSRRARALYRTTFQRFSGQLRVPLIAVGIMLVAGLAMLPLLNLSLVPSFQDRNVLVRLDGEPGTSNPRMTALATQLSEQLQAIPGVDNVGAHIGRAVTGDRVTNVNSSDVWVSIKPDADYDATISAIEDTARNVQGAQHEVVTYLTQKMRDVGALEQGSNRVKGNDLSLLTGSDRPLAVRVFGENPEVLRQEAARVKGIVDGVDGVSDARVDQPPTQPTIEIEVDLEKAQAFGITPGAVRRAEATLLQGIQVGSVFQQQKVFDVVVRGTPNVRRGIEDIRNLLIDRPDGGHVTLGQVADVRTAETSTVIERDAVSRRMDVEVVVSGRSVEAVAGDIKDRLAETSFPIEYHAEVLQESTSNEIGLTRVAAFALAVVLAAFLLFQAAFRSWSLAALLLAALPVSLVGGLVAVALTGGELSLGSMLGFLALLGLATRMCMLLVGNVQSLERYRRGTHTAALVERGAHERLAPVLTTAGALALLVLPFAVLGGRPGLELLHPMSVVIMGGLVSTILVTLLLLPAFYAHMPSRPARDDAPGDETPEPAQEPEPYAAGQGWIEKTPEPAPAPVSLQHEGRGA